MNSEAIFAKRLRLAVAMSAELVQDEAKQTHRFKTKSGRLEDAIKVRSERDGLVGVVFLDEEEANYARHVYFGTRPHFIRPRERMALRWPEGQNFVFAKVVSHPGTRPDPFLRVALATKKSEIDAIFAKQTESALEEVADALRGTEYIYRR